MHMGLVKIDIIDNDSLMKACDILHDGYCDLSNVLYDEKKGCWKAIFEREFLEEPTGIEIEPRFLFFNRVSFPMSKSELILEGVSTYKIEDKSNMQICSFNECQIKKGIYKLLFNEGMEMTFTFKDNPKGNLTDLQLLDKKGAFYNLRNPFKSKRHP